jgi:hypothetical protein
VVINILEEHISSTFIVEVSQDWFVIYWYVCGRQSMGMGETGREWAVA